MYSAAIRGRNIGMDPPTSAAGATSPSSLGLLADKQSSPIPFNIVETSSKVLMHILITTVEIVFIR